MNTKGVFVTGTDTGVGKTVVAAALLSLIRADGIDAVPMKPIQTGCTVSGDGLEPPDLAFCLRMTRVRVRPEERRLMAPYCFEMACSPHLAATQTGQAISISSVVHALAALATDREFVVVEGAGGVLAPINETETMLDLMAALELPVIVVARAGLGTINHTLLTLHELKRARLPVPGIVMNAAGPAVQEMIALDNRSTIARLGGTEVLGSLPFQKNLERMSREAFRNWCLPHLPAAKDLLKRMGVL